MTRGAGRVRIAGGRWRGRHIRVPRGGSVRPTSERVRQAWMNILRSELAATRVLDLYAGSGALGLEALSRGAAHVTFVEADPRALAVLRANIRDLDAVAQTEVIRGNALRFLVDLPPGSYDVILADPPYGRGLAAETLRAFLGRRSARLLALEHRRSERLEIPEGAVQRVYGDTVLLFVRPPEAGEEKQ